VAKRAKSTKKASKAAEVEEVEHLPALPWHAPVGNRLIALRDSDRLPNALALTCAPGWGDRHLLAQASQILLEEVNEKPISQVAHPDFRWIVPEGAVIKIDQVRRINELAVQTAQIAPRKVVAIAQAHLLNVNAANALLKMLEEPPPNTHILLGTVHWGKLLPTIRSRCQRFTSSPDQVAAKLWLDAQDITLTASQYAQLGHAPLNTVPGHAQGLGADDLESWLGALGNAPLAASVGALDDMDLVEWMGRWYRQILALVCDAPESDQARALHEFAVELLQARRQIATSNAANSRLLLEYLVVQWRKVMHG